MQRHLVDYLSYLSVERGSSPRTVESYGRDLKRYLEFLEGREAADPDLIVRDDVVAYVEELGRRGLKPASIERAVSAIKGFHRFLVRESITENHPTARLGLPKVPRTLPHALSVEDLTRLFEVPFPEGPLGLRDRAMLEVLYGCGLRVSELTGLDRSDVDLAEGLVRVMGKGSKERVVPVSGMAAHALRAYLDGARSSLRARRSISSSDEAVFVNSRGGRISRQSVFKLVREYGKAAGIDDLHPHTLRHSFATHMLEGGADLRSLQELLGHSDISTTEVYTHVDLTHVREEYLSTHPRARLR